MSTPFYKKARSHLVRSCPVMDRTIGLVGPCTMASVPGEPFTQIVRSVISQQISTKAARSIFERFSTMLGRDAIAPTTLASLTEAQFKECGISGAKQRTLRAVSETAIADPNFLREIVELEDEAVHERLTQIKGIGPWTADMFLIFGLLRPDVLPVGDYGVRVALQRLFRLRKLPDPARCMKLGKPWKPYRSVASWYLWRSLELKLEE